MAIYYGILHKETDRLMPEKRMSYTHWYPGKFPSRQPPRLFLTHKAATISARFWSKGAMTQDFEVEKTHRKFSDLEIVKLELKSYDR